MMRKTLQERIEASEVGRALIGAFLLVTLFSVITSNLPSSELQRLSQTVSQPYRRITGLDQRWGVFAPNPRNYVIALDARIRYSDGSATTWRIPRGDPVISRYRTYRWHKWMENVVRPGPGRAMWPSVSAWLARELDRDERHPTRITLVRRTRQLAPPGAEKQEGWQELLLYDTPVYGVPPESGAPP